MSLIRWWVEHPVDPSLHLPLSVMQRTHKHLLPALKNVGRRGRRVLIEGRTYETIAAAAKALKIPSSTLKSRLRAKRSIV